MSRGPRYSASAVAAQISAAATTRGNAELYASILRVGDKIVEDTDGPVIAPFRHFLPGELARLRLALEPIEGGWIVVEAPWAPSRAANATVRLGRVHCTACDGPFFDCACPATVVLGGVQQPVLPRFGIERERPAS